MSTAHVICCNDSVEYVVVDDEAAAEIKKDELSKRDYDTRYKWTYPTYEEYKHTLYWHIHSVGCTP